MVADSTHAEAEAVARVEEGVSSSAEGTVSSSTDTSGSDVTPQAGSTGKTAGKCAGGAGPVSKLMLVVYVLSGAALLALVDTLPDEHAPLRDEFRRAVERRLARPGSGA